MSDSVLDNITDVKRLALNEGEILIVTYARANIPPHIWERNAEKIRTLLSTALLTNKIYVVSDEMELTVIKQEKV